MKLEEPLINRNTRAYSYKTFSECYYPPDDELIKKLTNLDESMSELAKNAREVNDIKLLKIDFSRLFLGPFKLPAPPYGSLYLEKSGMTMGESTIDAKARYREEGLDITFKEAPDHIAIELEFMYFLIFREIEAQEQSDTASAERFFEKQKSFLSEHLGAWISEFTDTVEANAQTPLYKNLARLTKSFVENDLKNLLDT